MASFILVSSVFDDVEVLVTAVDDVESSPDAGADKGFGGDFSLIFSLEIAAACFLLAAIVP
jgi:hypothetical protein